MVTLDELNKLDIRIGTIISAQKVEGTDKLIHFEVDFGKERRSIVSGIAQYYDTSMLVGKQMPFIINLEPRTLRGITSQGMIFAVSMPESIALLMPDKTVPSGAVVR